MKWLAAVVFLTGFSSAWAQSDTGTTSVPASDVGVPETSSSSSLREILRDKKFDEDERVDDLELRAYAGSLNRYSFQASFGLSGPPVNNLGDPNRPNPDNRPGDNRSYVSGSMGLRYRISEHWGTNVGTGFQWYTPYQALINQPVTRRPGTYTYDISDPRASVDVTYVQGATQMRTSVSASATTTRAYVLDGQWAEATLSQYFKYTPGHGRWILGMQAGVDYFAYDRPYQAPNAQGRGGDGSVSKYYINLIPSVEYKLTSSLNFNTSIDYPYENLRNRSDWAVLYHPLSTWRVGVGWAITHDIYINPYINFFAESPAFNSASANFNTTISIF